MSVIDQCRLLLSSGHMFTVVASRTGSSPSSSSSVETLHSSINMMRHQHSVLMVAMMASVTGDTLDRHIAEMSAAYSTIILQLEEAAVVATRNRVMVDKHTKVVAKIVQELTKTVEAATPSSSSSSSSSSSCVTPLSVALATVAASAASTSSSHQQQQLQHDAGHFMDMYAASSAFGRSRTHPSVAVVVAAAPALVHQCNDASEDEEEDDDEDDEDDEEYEEEEEDEDEDDDDDDDDDEEDDKKVNKKRKRRVTRTRSETNEAKIAKVASDDGPMRN